MISLGNAAGWLKRPDDVEPLLRLPDEYLQEITLGSYTLHPREGNSGNVFWHDRSGAPTSLNALGLPNPGINEVEGFIGPLTKAIHNAGKIARVSVAGFSPDDYAELVRHLRGYRYVHTIELNFGCPNVRQGSVQERIMSFDPDALDLALHAVYRHTDDLGAPCIDVKLSPYSDPHLRREIGAMLRKNARLFQRLVVCNTLANAFGCDKQGRPYIDANEGYAGLAGKALKYVALGEVRQFRTMLSDENPIVGVGGASCGQDLVDLERAGAVAVQIGTAFFAHGDPRVFQDIRVEYAELKECEAA